MKRVKDIINVEVLVECLKEARDYDDTTPQNLVYAAQRLVDLTVDFHEILEVSDLVKGKDLAKEFINYIEEIS